MVIDEDKIPAVNSITSETLPALTYVNTVHKHFNLLDKIISFDGDQQEIFDLLPPLVIIGSAGSGKTALTLEKMKQATGDVLYVSHSPFLVKAPATFITHTTTTMAIRTWSFSPSGLS